MMKSFSQFHAVSKFAIDQLLYVSGGGYIVNEPDFHINRNYFDDFQCAHVLNGCFHLEQNNIHHQINKGESVIFDLRVKHKYYFNHDDSEILWMHFDGAHCEMLTNNIELPYIFTSEIPQQTIRKCLLLIANKPPQYEIEISKNIYNFLCEILLQNDLPYKDTDMLIKKVDQFIVENRSVPITLDMLSKHTNIGKYHLCRIFKERANKTPIQYVLFKKIEYAKDLMLFSNAKISDLYEELGFADQSHFSKTFKKVVGMFPTEFKKMHY